MRQEQQRLATLAVRSASAGDAGQVLVLVLWAGLGRGDRVNFRCQA